jgi:hypothetical protein
MRAMRASNELGDSRSISPRGRSDRPLVLLLAAASLVAGAACGSSALWVEDGSGGSPGVGGSAGAGGSAGTAGSTALDSGSDVGDGAAVDVGSEGGADAVAEADAPGPEDGDASGDAADTGAGGSGGTDGAVVGAYDIAVPFVVDDTSYSTGTAASCWGDSAAIKLADCASRASSTAVGKCHKITYAYAGAAVAWVAQTWKSIPSKKIAPGATKIQFYAWGSGAVKFREPTATASKDVPVVLAATPTKYTIDVTGTAYDATAQEVAFIVVFTSVSPNVVVNIDDLQWL